VNVTVTVIAIIIRRRKMQLAAEKERGLKKEKIAPIPPILRS
jgi:hypothetical protein